MSQENKMAKEFFDKQASETYDQRIKPIAPIIDNLHFLIRLILKDLPSDAHILCVGVGTGTEILELAQAFPYWRFTGIDPPHRCSMSAGSACSRAGF